MLKRNRVQFRILFLLSALATASASRAQSSPPSIDNAISQVAARIADPLQKVHATKVVFADLKGPDGQTHPVGRWLADQLADSCNKDFPDLEVIIRPKNEEAAPKVGEAGNQKQPFKSVEEWARSVGANVVVTGSFARVSDGIGVSLAASNSSGQSRYIAQVTGLVPLSDAITALSSEPIPSQKGAVPRAGVAGTGVPQCIYCPPPKYSGQARSEKYQGSVVLQVTVTTDGRATNISIVKDPGKGLGMQAVESVRKWRFKPAPGPDGKPVAVICPIEVTFRLY